MQVPVRLNLAISEMEAMSRNKLISYPVERETECLAVVHNRKHYLVRATFSLRAFDVRDYSKLLCLLFHNHKNCVRCIGCGVVLHVLCGGSFEREYRSSDLRCHGQDSLPDEHY